MRIIINTRFLYKDFPADYWQYNVEILNRVIINNPDHEFFLITCDSDSPAFINAKNVTIIKSYSKELKSWLWTFWYKKRIPAIIKKYKADVLIGAEGGCSLKTTIPQILFVHAPLALLEVLSVKKKQFQFFKHHHIQFLKTAQVVITTSFFLQKSIIENYKIEPDKVKVITAAPGSIFKTATDEEMHNEKEKYTSGREFFLYISDRDSTTSIIHLLKAFSGFKKRQKTSMKLVIAGEIKDMDTLENQLKAYKFREDVKIVVEPGISDVAKLMSSAYAFIDRIKDNGVALNILNAMQCGIPVLTHDATYMKEITNGNALFVNFSDYKSISEQMMLIYKDENRRNQLVKNGKLEVADKTWDLAARQFWQALQKAVN